MTTLNPEAITIAITVYDRQAYIREAIRSALAQRCNGLPKVIVVEDCGPDQTLRQSVLNEFGDRIQYFRNSRRRGLFDNWNACIEACRTPWLCILHDDDVLEPTFVQSMLELETSAPERALYYGRCEIIDDAGERVGESHTADFFSSADLPLEEWALYDPVCFPGQVFNVACSRTIGGFRAGSRYAADWELWFKLTLKYGSAATNHVVAKYRQHHSIGRGTTAVDISGRKYAYVNAQRKRNIALLRKLKPACQFDRRKLQRESPMSLRFILAYGYNFSPWIFRYNAGLLNLSSAPHLPYLIFQSACRLFTWRSLWVVSLILHILPFGSERLELPHAPAQRSMLRRRTC